VSKTIELPDEVYERIAAEASAAGTTPAEWIAAQVTNGAVSATALHDATRAETNGDSIGVVNVTLSEAVYERLTETAAASGITPEAWISGRLPSPAPVYITSKGEPARTLADMMEGLIGTYASSGSENLSENHSALFGEHLEAQRRAGRL